MSKNDPSVICRGKNLHLPSLKHFIAAIPKTAMPKAQFFAYAEQRMKGFQKTHSQIARQLGLYYCDAQGICHPRFTEDVSFEAIFKYGQYWAHHYFVPNPFTKSFPQNCSPTCIYGYFLAHAKALGYDVNAIFGEMFGIDMADLDKAKSYLFNFTELTEVDDGKVSVPDECVRVDESVLLQRDDELAYYHYFDGWRIGECGTPILVESSLRLFAKKVFVYLSEHEDGLQRVFSKCEQYSIASGEGRLKIINSNPDVYLTGLFMHESQAHVNGANASDTHERWHADYDFQGLGGSNFLSGEWSLREYKENKPDVRLALTYPSFKRLVEWLYPKYEISKSDDVFCFSRLKHQERFAGNVLSTALGVFSERRQKLDWCADNTDGDTSKPRAGYVANLQLRKFLNDAQTQLKLASDDAGNVRAWFKEFWDPDTGKNWLGDLTDAELKDFGPYVCDLIQPSAHKPPRPPKFSLSLEAAVKTVIKPGESCFYDKRVHDALKFLGLTDGEFNPDFTDEDYQLAKSAQIVLKRRLKKLIPNGQVVEWDATANPPAAKENNQEPDFLTVNEFLWFVKMHLNEIESEVVEKKMEPAKHKELPNAEKNKKPVVNMEDSDDVLLLRLRAALRTKPFAILAGHSGTGKSRMVRKLAYMTCNDARLRYEYDEHGNVKNDAAGKPVPLKEPGNFCMVQVKPNWHDSCDLLGYYSELGKRYRASEFVKFICKAYAYPKTPFFVCLDEMNLAPVEQYFAEYLSAIESRKLTGEVMTTDELVPKTAYVLKDETGEVFHYDWLGCETTEAEGWLKEYGLTIPRNLFVVGTVNMDESTNQFSRKVLDRAMTIEMTDADFDNFGKQPPELNYENVGYMGDEAIADLLAGKVQAASLSEDQKNNLNALKNVLASSSFAVAYRFANEYALYEDSLKSAVEKSVKPKVDGQPEETLTLESESASQGEHPDAEQSQNAAEANNQTAEGAPATDDSAAAKAPAIPSAFDDMVLMKVLPRISGDEADVKRIFYEGANANKDPHPTAESPADNTLLKLLGAKKDTASVRKIKWILARGGSYLSFWP